MDREHLDPNVQQAIDHLCDELCTWERATGRESVLIIREPSSEFCFRAQSGKPLSEDLDDISDQQVMAVVGHEPEAFEELIKLRQDKAELLIGAGVLLGAAGAVNQIMCDRDDERLQEAIDIIDAATIVAREKGICEPED